ncbi:MAG: CBS domain-containing protein [bacterium]
MQVKEIMTNSIAVISPDATLKEATVMMKYLDFGALLVTESRVVLGLITAYDVTIAGVIRGCKLSDTSIREVMKDNPDFCFEDQDIEETARFMKEGQISHLLVINRNKLLVGILSFVDIGGSVGNKQAKRVFKLNLGAANVFFSSMATN